MTESEFTQLPIYQSMTPIKQGVLLELLRSAQGTPLEKAMPLILQANNKLKSEGQSFSREESNLMIDLLTQNMSPAERAKVDMMRKFIK